MRMGTAQSEPNSLILLFVSGFSSEKRAFVVIKFLLLMFLHPTLRIMPC